MIDKILCKMGFHKWKPHFRLRQNQKMMFRIHYIHSLFCAGLKPDESLDGYQEYCVKCRAKRF